MELLAFLWWSSLILAAVALGWMAWLIVARMRREPVAARQRRNRVAVERAYMALMAGDGEASGLLLAHRQRPRLLAEVLLDVLAIVRGAERDRLIAGIAGADLDDHFRQRLARRGAEGRLACAEALGAFPGPETEAALRETLRTSGDPELRVAAIRSLIDIDAAPSVGEVLSHFDRRDAAQSLLFLPVIRRLAVANPDEVMARLSDSRLSAAAQALLITAVGTGGDYRTLPLLEVAATSTETGVRMAAVTALGQLGHPAASGVVMGALADPAWEVRAAACEACGLIGLKEAAEPLAHRLADDIWWVRYRAGEALARLGELGFSLLARTAEEDLGEAGRAAALALAEKGFAAKAA